MPSALPPAFTAGRRLLRFKLKAQNTHGSMAKIVVNTISCPAGGKNLILGHLEAFSGLAGVRSGPEDFLNPHIGKQILLIF